MGGGRGLGGGGLDISGVWAPLFLFSDVGGLQEPLVLVGKWATEVISSTVSQLRPVSITRDLFRALLTFCFPQLEALGKHCILRNLQLGTPSNGCILQGSLRLFCACLSNRFQGLVWFQSLCTRSFQPTRVWEVFRKDAGVQREIHFAAVTGGLFNMSQIRFTLARETKRKAAQGNCHFLGTWTFVFLGLPFWWKSEKFGKPNSWP